MQDQYRQTLSLALTIPVSFVDCGKGYFIKPGSSLKTINVSTLI